MQNSKSSESKPFASVQYLCSMGLDACASAIYSNQPGLITIGSNHTKTINHWWSLGELDGAIFYIWSSQLNDISI